MDAFHSGSFLRYVDHSVALYWYNADPLQFESKEELESFDKFREVVEERCQTIDIEKPWLGEGKYYDSMTFDEFAKRSGASPKTVEYANLWVRAMVGIDGTEISALYFLHYCKSGGGFKQMRSDGKDGGQHLRSKTGKMHRCPLHLGVY